MQSTTVTSGTILSFRIGGIRNPISLQPSSSFSILTKTGENYKIDSKSTGITMTMQTPSSITNASISITSKTNGAQTDYSFMLKASSPLEDGNILYIKVPSEVSAPIFPSCRGITSNLSPTLN